MAKVTIGTIFELSRYLATKSGQELRDALEYISQFAEVSLRCLRGGLTFSDNFDGELKMVSVRTDTETIIKTVSKKRASQIMIRRVVNDRYYVTTGFGWKFSNSGDIVIKVIFDDSPAATLDITLELLILF